MQVRGACAHDCPDTCSWIVTVKDGQAQTLTGDPAHPFTRGTLCAKVNSYLERVYHPSRVLYPMKRAGAKGSGEFARVSWAEALGEISDRWRAIIAEHGAQAILPYSSAGTQGLIQMASLTDRLFGVLGVTALERNICGVVAKQGISMTQGNNTGIDPEDIVHSRYIVLWGTNTLVTNLHLWPFIREARSRGARLVVIDPIRTRTAEEADWHLAPKPATDAVLALAMMHVILREGLEDREYVERHATGFDTLRAKAEEYPPERAAAITGLCEADISRLAREYVSVRPSLLRLMIGPEHHVNGAEMFAAIACLPVVTGAWRERGGGLARSTGALQYSALDNEALLRTKDWVPAPRTLNMRDLGRDLCSLDPPVRSLFVHSANPVVTIPNRDLIEQGLQREDLFTVVHDLFITETARYADYLLPATSQIEQLDLMPAWGHHYLSLNRPAIAPLGEAVSNTELARRLARALGRTETWLYDSDETLIRTALASGDPMLAGITYERLWQEGSVKLTLPEDWRPFAQGGFATPTGKARLESIAEAPGEIRQPSAEWPLQLITGKSLHDLNGSYSQSERHRRRAGAAFIELHAADAASRGLSAGARVRVMSPQGSLENIECRVSDRLRPGVAWMPFGGHAEGVNRLTPEAPTKFFGGSGFYDCFVQISGT